MRVIVTRERLNFIGKAYSVTFLVRNTNEGICLYYGKQNPNNKLEKLLYTGINNER